MLLYDQLDDSARKTIDQLGPKMDVTNIAEYYYHHDKEVWMIGEDFPHPNPPFKTMWVEYRYPRELYSKQVGTVLVKSYDKGLVPYFGCFVSSIHEFQWREGAVPGEFGRLSIRDKKPGLHGNIGMAGAMWYIDRATGRPATFNSVVSARFNLDKDGNVSEDWYLPTYMGANPEDMATMLTYFHPVMMAFSFANCKNIEIVEVKPPVKLNKARARRGNRQLVSYKVINVLPFGKTYKQQSRTVESDGQGVALHIRAGNFARYGEKYGRGKLFGKFEGMFWRPQSVVGSADAGVSVHDYAVKKD